MARGLETREQGRHRAARPRRAGEGLLEEHAFAGQAIEVGCVHDGVAVRAQAVRAQAVHHVEQQVGPASGWRAAGQCAGEDEKPGASRRFAERGGHAAPG